MKPFVLIGESDHDLRIILEGFFRKEGFDVAQASSGLDCLQELRRTRPIAVVLDSELNWGGSEGLLDVMREERDLRDVPVILTSSRPYDPLFDRVSWPVVRTLRKPFSLNLLLNSVRAASPHDQSAVAGKQ